MEGFGPILIGSDTSTVEVIPYEGFKTLALDLNRPEPPAVVGVTADAGPDTFSILGFVADK